MFIYILDTVWSSSRGDHWRNCQHSRAILAQVHLITPRLKSFSCASRCLCIKGLVILDRRSHLLRSRQQAMASSRAAEWISPDDSASATGSAASWSVVQEGVSSACKDPVPCSKAASPKVLRRRWSQESAPAGQEEEESETDMPPQDGWEADLPKAAPPQAAPAVQAAKQLLGSA